MASTHQWPVDSRLEHRTPGSAALTADTTLATISQQGSTRTQRVTVINVEALEASNADNAYTFYVDVSDTSGFTAYETAAIASLGHTSAKEGGGATTAAGHRAEIFWSTEVNGKSYRYARIRLVTAGTSKSITLSAFTSTLFLG